MRFAQCGAIALLVAGALAPASVLGAGDKLIAPGRGIGGAVIGMTEAEAGAALGKPTARLHVSDGYLDIVGELQLFIGENGRVVRVETESADYRTKEGIGVGSMEADIIAKLGPAALAEDIKTRNDNILMTIGRRLCYEPGLVFIADFEPRQPRAITHVAVRSDGCKHAFGKP